MSPHAPQGAPLQPGACPRILGIDPGLRLTGYGIVQLPPADAPGFADPTLIEAGVLKLDTKLDIPARLAQLDADLQAVIAETRPSHMAVEKLYAHYKHPTTAILMAHARGVIMLVGHKAGLTLEDLPATEVKKAVTGHGHASKEQIQEAVRATLRLAQPPSPPDVADALAIALCAARRLHLNHLTTR